MAVDLRRGVEGAGGSVELESKMPDVRGDLPGWE